MKSILTDNTSSILRFDQGEDVIVVLAEFCRTQTISAATFSGLGAAGDIVIAYYNLQTKRYEDHQFTENLEILNLTGNVGTMDEKYIVHCHGMFGRNDCSTIGGHVKKLIVSATCELTVQKLSGTMVRTYDEKTGLNLLV